ncbi:MAG: hypothetical protein M3426_08115 [Actinomycetota bacterium]|nr:hypothetical protein [Actinomycetota bacterium]
MREFAFADYQPTTQVVDTVRGLLLDQPVGSQVWQALTWCVGMLLVFVPLSVSLGATRRVEQL